MKQRLVYESRVSGLKQVLMLLVVTMLTAAQVVQAQVVRNMAADEVSVTIGDGTDNVRIPIASDRTPDDLVKFISVKDGINELSSGIDYELYVTAPGMQSVPIAEWYPIPGTNYVIIAQGCGSYTNSKASNKFTLYAVYDLMLDPVPTTTTPVKVTVAGTDRPYDKFGMAKAIERGKKVTITSTDDNYMLRNVKVTTKPNMKATPLTFEAAENGVELTFELAEGLVGTIKQSKDGNRWNETIVSADATTVLTITLEEGEKVMFTGNIATYALSTNNYSQFAITGGDCYIYGNVMSLINSQTFPFLSTLTDDYAFFCLFMDNEHIINHPTKDLVLPATTLSDYCYCAMFWGCTSLTRAPLLPAQTLAYASYMQMFNDCTGLKSVTCLATDISAQDCTYNWLRSVSTGGTFTKPATTNWSVKTSSSGIPSGWTVVNLPAE